MYFDETHCYDRKYLKPEEFAVDKWHEEDDKLFADFTNIVDASESAPEFNTIPCKSNKIYFYSDKSCGLSWLSDISDRVGDRRHY